MRDVLHALTAARQLETVVVEGKTSLFIPGALPEFEALPVEAQPVEDEISAQASAEAPTQAQEAEGKRTCLVAQNVSDDFLERSSVANVAVKLLMSKCRSLNYGTSPASRGARSGRCGGAIDENYRGDPIRPALRWRQSRAGRLPGNRRERSGNAMQFWRELWMHRWSYQYADARN